MNSFLCIVILSIVSSFTYADDLSKFKDLYHKADSAYSTGDLETYFQLEEEIISLFETNRKKYLKNNEICEIVYNAYGSLAIQDKSKTEEEQCDLLLKCILLTDDNPLWVQEYTSKSTIYNFYLNLVGTYTDLGKIDEACEFNERMISFAEKYYSYELPNVLLTACLLYSSMKKDDHRYRLYQRLYGMLDDLDRNQQFKVVSELILCEFTKKNYAEVIKMGQKHVNLIYKSKDQNRDYCLGFVCLSFYYQAINYAQENPQEYSEIAASTYEAGCKWACMYYPVAYTLLCNDYACWLYCLDGYTSEALEQFYLYLDAIEHTPDDNVFDEDFRMVEDVEQAIISILINTVIKADKPADVNEILAKYPRIMSAIKHATSSEYYDDFNEIISICKDICYGEQSK